MLVVVVVNLKCLQLSEWLLFSRSLSPPLLWMCLQCIGMKVCSMWMLVMYKRIFIIAAKKIFNLKESKLLPHMLTLRDVTRILITYNNKWSHFLHLLRRFHYFLWRIRILFLIRRRGIRYNLKHISGFERKLLPLPEVSFEPQPRITALRFSTLHYQCTSQPQSNDASYQVSKWPCNNALNNALNCA